MEMEYFIIFGSVLLLVLGLTFIIIRLHTKISDLTYELKLDKINYQKDLDRLEDRVNQFSNQSNDTNEYKKEIEKLSILIKDLNNIIDNRTNDSKKIINDN